MLLLVTCLQLSCADVKAVRGQAQEEPQQNTLCAATSVWVLASLGRSVSHSWDHMCEHVPEGGTQAKGQWGPRRWILGPSRGTPPRRWRADGLCTPPEALFHTCDSSAFSLPEPALLAPLIHQGRAAPKLGLEEINKSLKGPLGSRGLQETRWAPG